jgi:hypothetical protein
VIYSLVLILKTEIVTKPAIAETNWIAGQKGQYNYRIKLNLETKQVSQATVTRNGKDVAVIDEKGWVKIPTDYTDHQAVLAIFDEVQQRR